VKFKAISLPQQQDEKESLNEKRVTTIHRFWNRDGPRAARTLHRKEHVRDSRMDRTDSTREVSGLCGY